jgi:hypothetical protein
MAANASSRVQPMAISGEMIENHRAEPEYKRFIGEVCNKLEWETPWDQAARWLSRYRTWPEFDGIYPFLAGLRLRLEKPLFFGLPNFFFESTGESWNNYLQRLPIPPFADGKGEPLYWVSPDHTHPSTTALMYTRAMGVLVDDIILNAGPIDWEGSSGRIRYDECERRGGEPTVTPTTTWYRLIRIVNPLQAAHPYTVCRCLASVPLPSTLWESLAIVLKRSSSRSSLM